MERCLYLTELNQSDNVVEMGLALGHLALQQTNLIHNVLDILGLTCKRPKLTVRLMLTL